MSDESNVIQETVHPAGNLYDGSESAYSQNDQAQSLEQALEEKQQVEELKDQVQELESQESEEPKTEESTEQKSENSEFSSKFAALSRREKALREKESQIDAKLAELEEKMNALNAPAKESEESKEPELPLEYRLKKDPLGTLKELGLPYDTLTNLALNDGKLTPEMQMELMKQEIDQKYSSQIEALKAEIEERDKRLEEEKYNETVTNFKTELTNFVNDNDKYELIRANDAAEVVYDVIEEHYKETGRIMSKEEAADQVESYLEEEVEKLLKLNKLKSKFGNLEAKTEPQQPKETQKTPTLSNELSATSSKTTSRNLTRDQSVAAAASLLKWNE